MENLSFHELSFEGFFEFDREQQKTFDFEIEIGERFLVATNLIVISEKILSSMSIIGIVTLIICFFIGIPILELIFQLDLSIYQIPFELIILASIFYAMTMIISSLLTILGENRRQTYIYLIATIIATITAILLIPISGIIGAIYSFLISSFVLIILYIVLLQYKLHKVNHVK